MSLTAVAMSGGVDSSVAALKAVEAKSPSEDLIGIHLHLWEGEGGEAETSCCTPESTRVARRTAEMLGIPFYTFNLSEVFRKKVVQPFMDGYARGETPNPCVTCNRTVKFGALASAASRLGAKALVTGHYARTEGPRLFQGTDEARDQSYFLYGIPLALKGRLSFPLGAMSKGEVRQAAREKGLPAAARPDSQEVCFVPAQGYKLFLDRHEVRSASGVLATADGKTLAKHDGIHGYTRGQRARVAGSATPLYVLNSDASTGTVTVGPDAELFDSTLSVKDLRGWNLPKLEGSGQRAAGSKDETEGLMVRVRYRGEAVPCEIQRNGRRAVLKLGKPVRAAAPGQSAVLYRGDEVLGGGIITSAVS